MRLITKFLCLSAGDRYLLISAIYRLLVIRISLWALPLQRLIKPLPDCGGAATSDYELSAKQTAWAIETASRHLPGVGNCLVQALACRTMLTRRGCPARLRLGVGRDKEGRFRAHAWVESEGRIVIGRRGSFGRAGLPALRQQSQA